MADTVYPGNATPTQVLAGQTFSAGANYSTAGTMPNNGKKIITPGTAQQPIPQGYHDGTGYVPGDANLVAANILNGASIFGVAGYAVGNTPRTTYANNASTSMAATVLSVTGSGRLKRLGIYYSGTTSTTLTVSVDGTNMINSTAISNPNGEVCPVSAAPSGMDCAIYSGVELSTTGNWVDFDVAFASSLTISVSPTSGTVQLSWMYEA